MKVVNTKAQLRAQRDLWPSSSRIGFVPTMGALHAGHGALLARAREISDQVVVSVFINPTQFGPGEDFDAYPRVPEEDIEFLEAAGVDLAWFPERDELYSERFETRITLPRMARRLCGVRRPDHFAGVALIVTKLFHVVRPDVAVFGRKDYQQLAILRQLVEDLDFALSIEALDTVREADGLAMSSRNRRLSAKGREQATVLSRALFDVRRQFRDGERDRHVLMRTAICVVLGAKGVKLEYLELVDASSLEPIDRIEGDAVMLIAAHVEGVRLIDNVELAS